MREGSFVDGAITKPAEYAMVLDLMSRMAALDSEDNAIARILELFEELCAPRHLAYVSVVEGGLPGKAYCRPVVTDGEDIIKRLCGFSATWSELDSGEGFVLAVKHAGERLGVLEVDGIALPEQRSHYLNLALSIVDVLGLAISNARLHERLLSARADAQAERDVARDLLGLSDALNVINETINSTLDFGEIVRRVVVQAAEVTRADRVGLLRRIEGHWELSWGHGYEDGLVGTVFSDEELPFAVRAAEQREVVWDNDAEKTFRNHERAALAHDTHSIMNVPIVLKDQVFGVLSFRSRHPGAFTPRSADFAHKLAGYLSLALANVRLYETQHTIAETLQQALLVMPKRIRGIDFGNLYQASSRESAAAGGDFYDLFEIDHRSVGVVIGDVSGKGLKAATLTSLVKDSIRAFTHIGTSPAWVIEKTSQLLYESTDDTTFATVFVAVIDTPSGAITYCRAGHPTPLIRAVDGTVRGLAVGSTIVGAFEQVEARDGHERLSPGEVLVLYTDGITEARCEHSLMGEERFADLVGVTVEPAGEMPQALLERVKSCPNADLPDDVALLCVSLAARDDAHTLAGEGQLSLTE